MRIELGRLTGFPSRALLLSGAFLVACDGAQDPAVAPSVPTAIHLSAHFPDAVSGGDGEAYDAADAIWVRLTPPGEAPVFDEILPFDPSGPETAVEIEVELDRQTTLLLEIELRRGPDALFRGSTEVTAAPGRAATATIDLEAVPADVLIPEALGPLASIGETAPLEGFAVFATGDTARSLTVEWTSLDPAVAVVVTSGGEPAVSAVGDGIARIEASVGPLVETLTVTVDLQVVAVDVEPPASTIPIRGTVRLTARATDALGNVLPGRSATWVSDDPTVASVDGNGLVRGVRVGSVEITATVEGVEGTATVEVEPAAPTATTVEAVNVEARSATLQGIVNPNGAATTVRFEWATNPSLDGAVSTEETSIGSGITSVAVEAELTGLSPGTAHWFRVVATNDVGTSAGQIRRFDTQEQPAPTVVTEEATEIGSTGATLNGVVNPAGAATTAWFEWSTEPDLDEATATEAVSVGSGSADVDVSAELTELEPGTTYYFRAVAMNEAGTSAGEILDFETAEQPAPSVLTLLPSAIGLDGALLQGVVNPNGAATTAWFEWADNATLDGAFATPDQAVGSGSEDVIVTAELVELEAETTYYVRVAASNVAGTSRGSILSFRTAIIPPTNLDIDPGGTSNFLVWEDNSGVETSYRIERSTTSPTGGFSTIASVGANVTFYQDPPPLPSGTLYYRVRACEGSVCSTPSNVVSVFVPEPVIQGTVTICGAACSPAVGIQVTLTGPVNRAALTDANGVYRFTNPPVGTYQVSVQDQPCDPAVDFSPNSRTVQVIGGGAVVVADFTGTLVIC